MSKQLQKLNYAPEEVEISVIGSSTPTTGSLTITQIKTLLASDQNYIKYTINTTTSEYLYFTNFTNNTAFYGADLYNATTSVYYRHLIKISYSSDLSSATWNYYNIPIITGSSSDLQEKLVSGTNIKTINGNSVLGSGNLAISEFPERSETDATLVQIAGLNSNGLPDVGKVAAGNISSTGATQGQVLTANGSGGCAWANAGGGGGALGYTVTITAVDPSAEAYGIKTDNTIVSLNSAGTYIEIVRIISADGQGSFYQDDTIPCKYLAYFYADNPVLFNSNIGYAVTGEHILLSNITGYIGFGGNN